MLGRRPFLAATAASALAAPSIVRAQAFPAQRVTAAGYRYRMTGENIAAGPSRAEDAVAGWIKSPPHCANLMSPAFNEMGVGFAINNASDMGVYWAQAFGTRR